ncbi:hypothetical protein [Acrocarpospora corrugata]|nr:hypothetical protein [Acrocarpospora corrugata]
MIFTELLRTLVESAFRSAHPGELLRTLVGSAFRGARLSELEVAS